MENGTDKDVEFLDEINQPVKLASDEPEPMPEIPAPEDLPEHVDEKLENKEVLIEKFGLEEIEQPTQIETGKWLKLCALVITGHNEKEVTKADVDASLIRQGVSITAKQEDHLDFLRGTRSMLISGEMNLKTALDQNAMFAEEKVLFETFAKENNLK